MIKELRKQINEKNLLKIKIYGLCSAFSLVFSFFNVILATYGHMYDMIIIVPFGGVFAVIGIIGFICFFVDVCQVIAESLN